LQIIFCEYSLILSFAISLYMKIRSPKKRYAAFDKAMPASIIFIAGEGFTSGGASAQYRGFLRGDHIEF